jgi:hypothetical protein
MKVDVWDTRSGRNRCPTSDEEVADKKLKVAADKAYAKYERKRKRQEKQDIGDTKAPQKARLRGSECANGKHRPKRPGTRERGCFRRAYMGEQQPHLPCSRRPTDRKWASLGGS